MLHFCTLFDANYLARGLVTYESLRTTTEGGAHLYVFAFDDKCYDVLTTMQLPNLTVISLSEFEDEQLLAIKPTRSRVNIAGLVRVRRYFIASKNTICRTVRTLMPTCISTKILKS